MRMIAAIVTALSLIAFPLVASAEARVGYTEGGRTLFSIDVPGFWTMRVGGDMALSPPGANEHRQVAKILALLPTRDPHVWMGFYSPPGVRTIEEGRDYMRNAGRFLVEDPEITDRSSQSFGGRPASLISGHGRRDGKAIRFSLAIIDLPGPRVAIGVAVAEPGATETEIAAVNHILRSFRVSP